MYEYLRLTAEVVCGKRINVEINCRQTNNIVIHKLYIHNIILLYTSDQNDRSDVMPLWYIIYVYVRYYKCILYTIALF